MTAPAPTLQTHGTDDVPSLDPVIHEASRLRLMAILSECEVADFNFLLGLTGFSRGNLCVHMSKLVQAGYVAEKKEFIGKKPHTEYNLTAGGMKAYDQYQRDWQKWIRPGVKAKKSAR
ncbi:MAG: transcriptional regulator [Planctomycetota bacterium]